MHELLEALASWTIDVIHSFGYIGVALLVTLETVIPIIPSEVILPLSGFLVGQGRFSFPLVLLAATTGSVVGALVLYGLGRWMGEARLRELTRKYGRYVLIGEDDLDRVRDWFDRHGGKAVLIGRTIPGIRSMISIPAGIDRMPLWQFVIYTAIGSGVADGILIALGWALGSQWQKVSQYAQYLSYVVLAIIAAAVAWFVYKRTLGEREHG